MKAADISHIKLEKGSVLVVRGGDYSQADMHALKKGFDSLGLGFKVPILFLNDHGDIEVVTIDKIITELEGMKSEAD